MNAMGSGAAGAAAGPLALAIRAISFSIMSDLIFFSTSSLTPGSSTELQSAPSGKAPCMLSACDSALWVLYGCLGRHFYPSWVFWARLQTPRAVSMERLRSLVLRLANADRVGGRAIIVDGQTLILYDCMHWGCHCTDVVLSHFPETQISVRACRQSLSGFTVVFHTCKSTRNEIVWYLVIGLCLACCSYVLLRPPWWVDRIQGI